MFKFYTLTPLIFLCTISLRANELAEYVSTYVVNITKKEKTHYISYKAIIDMHNGTKRLWTFKQQKINNLPTNTVYYSASIQHSTDAQPIPFNDFTQIYYFNAIVTHHNVMKKYLELASTTLL